MYVELEEAHCAHQVNTSLLANVQMLIIISLKLIKQYVNSTLTSEGDSRNKMTWL